MLILIRSVKKLRIARTPAEQKKVFAGKKLKNIHQYLQKNPQILYS